MLEVWGLVNKVTGLILVRVFFSVKELALTSITLSKILTLPLYSNRQLHELISANKSHKIDWSQQKGLAKQGQF